MESQPWGCWGRRTTSSRPAWVSRPCLKAKQCHCSPVSLGQAPYLSSDIWQRQVKLARSLPLRFLLLTQEQLPGDSLPNASLKKRVRQKMKLVLQCKCKTSVLTAESQPGSEVLSLTQILGHSAVIQTLRIEAVAQWYSACPASSRLNLTPTLY